jgi:hypothetical protein
MITSDERRKQAQKAAKIGARINARKSKQRRDEKIQSLEITQESLHEKYIDENLTLTELADYYGVSIGWIRNILSIFGVAKSPKRAAQNSKKTSIQRYGIEYYAQRLVGNQPNAKARQKGWVKRNQKINEKYASKGIIPSLLYQKYITENMSITQVGKELGLTKAQTRRVLSRFGVIKSKDYIILAKQKSSKEFYADPVRVRNTVIKTQKTVAERYGNKWYRKTTSSEEDQVFQYLLKFLPPEEIIRSDYTTIVNPKTQAPLQLDFLVPSRKIAIEYNGIYWHDKALWQNDIKNETCLSRERLKSILCQGISIRLIHIWSDEWKLNKEKSFYLMKAFSVQSGIETLEKAIEIE